MKAGRAVWALTALLALAPLARSLEVPASPARLTTKIADAAKHAVGAGGQGEPARPSEDWTWTYNKAREAQEAAKEAASKAAEHKPKAQSWWSSVTGALPSLEPTTRSYEETKSGVADAAQRAKGGVQHAAARVQHGAQDAAAHVKQAGNRPQLSLWQRFTSSIWGQPTHRQNAWKDSRIAGYEAKQAAHHGYEAAAYGADAVKEEAEDLGQRAADGASAAARQARHAAEGVQHAAGAAAHRVADTAHQGYERAAETASAAASLPGRAAHAGKDAVNSAWSRGDAALRHGEEAVAGTARRAVKGAANAASNAAYRAEHAVADTVYGAGHAIGDAAGAAEHVAERSYRGAEHAVGGFWYRVKSIFGSAEQRTADAAHYAAHQARYVAHAPERGYHAAKDAACHVRDGAEHCAHAAYDAAAYPFRRAQDAASSAAQGVEDTWDGVKGSGQRLRDNVAGHADAEMHRYVRDPTEEMKDRWYGRRTRHEQESPNVAERGRDAYNWAKEQAQDTAEWAGDRARPAAEDAYGWAKDQAKDTAQWASDRARPAAKDAAGRAADTARWAGDRARPAAEHAAGSAADNVRWAADRAGNMAQNAGQEAWEYLPDKAKRVAGGAEEYAEQAADWASSAAHHPKQTARSAANKAASYLTPSGYSGSPSVWSKGSGHGQGQQRAHVAEVRSELRRLLDAWDHELQSQKGFFDGIKRMFGGGTYHMERFLDVGYDALESPLPPMLPPAQQQAKGIWGRIKSAFHRGAGTAEDTAQGAWQSAESSWGRNGGSSSARGYARQAYGAGKQGAYELQRRAGQAGEYLQDEFGNWVPQSRKQRAAHLRHDAAYKAKSALHHTYRAVADSVGSVVELNIGLLESLAATVGGFAGLLGTIPAALLLAALALAPPAALTYGAYRLIKTKWWDQRAQGGRQQASGSVTNKARNGKKPGQKLGPGQTLQSNPNDTGVRVVVPSTEAAQDHISPVRRTVEQLELLSSPNTAQNTPLHSDDEGAALNPNQTGTSPTARTAGRARRTLATHSSPEIGRTPGGNTVRLVKETIERRSAGRRVSDVDVEE